MDAAVNTPGSLFVLKKIRPAFRMTAVEEMDRKDLSRTG